MSEKGRLGRDVFLALAAVGWADGQLTADAADAIVRTAVDEGLSLEEIAEIEKATKEKVELGEIDRRGLSKEDRLFVYAVASWMTRLHGPVSDKEKDALAQLGTALSIPERPREHADAIVQEVAGMSENDRPFRYDLKALRTVITERLHEAQRLRREQAEATGPHAAVVETSTVTAGAPVVAEPAASGDTKRAE